jgi:hypothetical protein
MTYVVPIYCTRAHKLMPGPSMQHPIMQACPFMEWKGNDLTACEPNRVPTYALHPSKLLKIGN